MHTLLVAVASALLAAPVTAHGEPDVFIEVNPSSVPAGSQIGIRASCGDEHQSADVRSRAFPDVALQPQSGSPLMTAATTVPERTRPGEYQVNLRCANGAGATTELHILDMARPTVGPATGGGGTAGTVSGATLLLASGSVAAALGAGLLLRRRRAG